MTGCQWVYKLGDSQWFCDATAFHRQLFPSGATRDLCHGHRAVAERQARATGIACEFVTLETAAAQLFSMDRVGPPPAAGPVAGPADRPRVIALQGPRGH